MTASSASGPGPSTARSPAAGGGTSTGVREVAPGRSPWVGPLCWSAVALEGYDLVVLGVVLPSLLRDPVWRLSPATGSLISVVGLVGVMVGALMIGPLTDRYGRRRLMLTTVTVFSLLTLACAFAPGPGVFGVLRFLAGLGLGGVLPVAIAMVNEAGRARRGGSATTLVMTGYHVGAVVTALLGIVVIPAFGWRAMFVIGVLPALALVPLIALRLPESMPAARAADAAGPVATLFRDGRARATIAFWVASFMGLLLVYGLNTWLPEIMRRAGYALDAALALLLVLNVGAVVGLLIAGRVGDRVGLRTATIGWFVAAALFLALLAVRLPGVGIYVTVGLAGVFVFSSQVLVYAAVSHFYPASARATAIGSASGVGRLGAIAGPAVGGALLTAGLAYPWGFYVFAAVALLGALCMVAVGRLDTPPEEEAPAASAGAAGGRSGGGTAAAS